MGGCRVEGHHDWADVASPTIHTVRLSLSSLAPECLLCIQPSQGSLCPVPAPSAQESSAPGCMLRGTCLVQRSPLHSPHRAAASWQPGQAHLAAQAGDLGAFQEGHGQHALGDKARNAARHLHLFPHALQPSTRSGTLHTTNKPYPLKTQHESLCVVSVCPAASTRSGTVHATHKPYPLRTSAQKPMCVVSVCPAAMHRVSQPARDRQGTPPQTPARICCEQQQDTCMCCALWGSGWRVCLDP